MATLPGGTIVRVIAYNQYWKQVELADGRVGWIGAGFAERTTQTATIPCSGIVPGDYCDTTDFARCPNPSPEGIEPTRYTRIAPIYSCSTQAVTVPTTNTTSTPPKSSTIQVTESLKPKLDSMVATVDTKVQAKYGDNLDAKIIHYKALVVALTSIQKSAPKLADLIGYLGAKFEEKLAMLELEKVLQVN
jgi:hypothetical protein